MTLSQMDRGVTNSQVRAGLRLALCVSDSIFSCEASVNGKLFACQGVVKIADCGGFNTRQIVGVANSPVVRRNFETLNNLYCILRI